MKEKGLQFPQDWKVAFFIGIGGMGMNALVKFFLSKGLQVAGYDLHESALTKELIQLGVHVQYDTNVGTIPEEYKIQKDTVVVYTSVIPDSNPLFRFFTDGVFEVLKRSAVLGRLSKELFTVAIAGTHGKTTTTSLMAHIVAEAGLPSLNFLGGMPIGYDTNFIERESENSQETVMVVEADEYDYSFLELHPDIAVITNIDNDHMELFQTNEQLYQAFADFADRIDSNGYLILHEDVQLTTEPQCTVKKYGNKSSNDYQVISYNYADKKTQVDCRLTKQKITFNTVLSGTHNVNNCLATLAIADLLGIDKDLAVQAVGSFQGVHRRCEYVVNTEKLVYIDDYAHHPTEVKCFLESVKINHPTQKITCLFQSKLYSRTRDFARKFGEALSICDEVYVLPIYAAREEPIPGVTEELIIDQITAPKKGFLKKAEVLPFVKNSSLEVLLTIGAGDIDAFAPKIKVCLETYHLQ